MKCTICNKEKDEYGNNPWPVQNAGECCDECNKKYVLPARLIKFRERREKE